MKICTSIPGAWWEKLDRSKNDEWQLMDEFAPSWQDTTWFLAQIDKALPTVTFHMNLDSVQLWQNHSDSPW